MKSERHVFRRLKPAMNLKNNCEPSAEALGYRKLRAGCPRSRLQKTAGKGWPRTVKQKASIEVAHGDSFLEIGRRCPLKRALEFI
jgi:hypothetical protein